MKAVLILVYAITAQVFQRTTADFSKSLSHFKELLGEPGGYKSYELKLSLLPVTESETRGRHLLDGSDWTMAFCKHCNSSHDVIQQTPNLEFYQAVVPGAFAENFPFNTTIRNYFGYLIYKRTVNLSPIIAHDRFVLRFESVMYSATVYVNQVKVGSHEGGHLPFEFDISSLVKPQSSSFILDVVVSTVLTYDTIPPGIVKTDPLSNDTYQDYLFDFFHYCGILRSVWLYLTSETYIADATVITTNIDTVAQTAQIDINVSYVCPARSNCEVKMQIYDPKSALVGPIMSGAIQRNVTIPNAVLWTPIDYREDKSENVNQVYMIMIAIKEKFMITDVYYLKFGIRLISLNQTGIFINNQPLYCRGVGKHEDFPMHGRAISKQDLLHDFRVFKWLGGNCLRTSHYPYAPFFYELADLFGVAVISESPAVQLRYAQTFKSTKAQHQHAGAITEMYQALKNHPSIIAWSLANEPLVTDPNSRPYFLPLFALMRQLDPIRPVTFVDGDTFALPPENHLGDLPDFSCINRYFGWYHQSGQLYNIERLVASNIESFSKAYPGKPIIVTEYGAEAISGLHNDEYQLYTEEYQAKLLASYHRAFDTVHGNKSAPLIGELVWHYADFAARPRDLTRVGGLNNKGIFNRNRNPKLSAHVLRKRYNSQRLKSAFFNVAQLHNDKGILVDEL